MSFDLKRAADTVLDHAVQRAGGVPGVVAMATDARGNVYEGAAGQREAGGAAMTTDTVMCLFSCTKALTGVLLMQLVEEGRVALDEPARRLVPELGEVRVLEGFDADDRPLTRPPRSEITVGQLMLHTAGFGYEFFSADDQRYRRVTDTPSIISNCFDALRTVLLFDPGERWNYGCNIDWIGRLIETVYGGRRLGEVMAERLFAPLGIEDTAFLMTPSMQARRATIHMRAADGQLAPVPDLVLPQPPEMDMGGHGLYGTVGDYMKFIRMLLNDGAGAHGRVLKPETVQQLARNGLGVLKSSGWPTANPRLANAGEFFPGLGKSWAYTFMVNDEDAPTGRPAGSLSWAGLGNLYYWIDRRNGLGGFWGTQVLPFHDVGSYPASVDFESVVYRHRTR